MVSPLPWLGVLLGLCGPSLTVGQGVLALLAGAWGARARTGAPQLGVASAAALMMGQALMREGGWETWLAAVGLLVALHASPAERRVGAWLPPVPLVQVGAVVAVVLVMAPHALPLPEIVRPRALSGVAQVAAVVAVTGLALARGVRVPPGRGVCAGLVLAGLVPVLSSAAVLARTGAGDAATLVDNARRARALGLHRLAVDQLTAAMTTEDGRGEVGALRDIYWYDTREVDGSRRNATILRLGARGLEAAGEPASNVDALLRKAARRTTAGDVDGMAAWPGAERAREVALRANVPWWGAAERRVPRDGAMDCFAGTWCVMEVRLPPSRRTHHVVPAHVRLLKVAPSTGDALVVLHLTFRDWNAQAILAADALEVGQQGWLTLPVDMEDPRPGEHLVWMTMMPLDGGASLTLDGRPGSALAVGTLRP